MNPWTLVGWFVAAIFGCGLIVAVVFTITTVKVVMTSAEKTRKRNGGKSN